MDSAFVEKYVGQNPVFQQWHPSRQNNFLNQFLGYAPSAQATPEEFRVGGRSAAFSPEGYTGPIATEATHKAIIAPVEKAYGTATRTLAGGLEGLRSAGEKPRQYGPVPNVVYPAHKMISGAMQAYRDPSRNAAQRIESTYKGIERLPELLPLPIGDVGGQRTPYLPIPKAYTRGSGFFRPDADVSSVAPKIPKNLPMPPGVFARKTPFPTRFQEVPGAKAVMPGDVRVSAEGLGQVPKTIAETAGHVATDPLIHALSPKVFGATKRLLGGAAKSTGLSELKRKALRGLYRDRGFRGIREGFNENLQYKPTSGMPSRMRREYLEANQRREGVQDVYGMGASEAERLLRQPHMQDVAVRQAMSGGAVPPGSRELVRDAGRVRGLLREGALSSEELRAAGEGMGMKRIGGLRPGTVAQNPNYLPRTYDIYEKGISREELAKRIDTAISNARVSDPGLAKKLIRNKSKILFKFDEGGALPHPGEIFAKPTGAKQKIYKRRKDIPETIRRDIYGEGNVPLAHSIPKKIALMGQDVSMRNMMFELAQKPGFARPVREVHKARKLRTMAFKNYELVKGEKWGPWSGKYVPKSAIRDVLDIQAPKGMVSTIYKNVVQVPWKMMHTVLSPPTQTVNAIGNSILADMQGFPFPHQLKYLAKNFVDLQRRSGRFQQAVRYGAISPGATFVGAELGLDVGKGIRIAGPRTKTTRMAEKIAGFGKQMQSPIAAKVYQGIENTHKMAMFDYLIEVEKMAPALAAQKTIRALFNYGHAPKAIKALSGSPVMPFAIFPYKAAGAITNTLANDPVKLYKYKSLFNAMEEQAKLKFNLTDQDIEKMKSAKPFMEIPVVTPFSSEEGHPLIFSAGRFLPLANFLNPNQNYFLGGPLQGPMETVTGMDFFFKNKLRREDDVYNPSEVQVRAENLYKKALSPVAPPIPGLIREGGYGTRRFIRGIRGIKDPYGFKPDVGLKALDAFLGVKFEPMTPRAAEAGKTLDISRKLNRLNRSFTRGVTGGPLSGPTGQYTQEDIQKAAKRLRKANIRTVDDYRNYMQDAQKKAAQGFTPGGPNPLTRDEAIRRILQETRQAQ